MNASLTETRLCVEPEWVDYNGHMNLAFYVLAFDKATDHFYDQLDIGLTYRERMQSSMFTLGINVDYLREVFAGDMLRITTQLLACDAKRMRYFHRMFSAAGDEPVATNECLAVHVDMEARRSAPFPAATRARIDAMLEAHLRLPVPAGAGRVLGEKRGA